MIDQPESEPVARDMAEAVDIAIASAAFGAAEAGVVALVRRYAGEVDAAHEAEAEFEKLLRDGELRATAYQRLSKLEGKVRAATTVAEVGPKLLAALEALGLSPAARAKLGKGLAPAAAPEDPRKTALAGLRDELAPKRAERMGS